LLMMLGAFVVATDRRFRVLLSDAKPQPAPQPAAAGIAAEANA